MYIILSLLTLSIWSISNQETHIFKVSNGYNIDTNTNKSLVKWSTVLYIMFC